MAHVEPLKRGTLKCPKDKTPLHWEQLCGMRIYRQVTPPKPKRPYKIYTARCPECGATYSVKR